mmetsp:Transcript_46505/g.123439  ORF Transcript_46505/g.123439 Transcript_46505/m.123439 type:complete len:320 (+) Transcript_46505:353-1312(+)
MVRLAREKEKLHHSLQDFISDVAPMQISAAVESKSEENPSEFRRSLNNLTSIFKSAFSDSRTIPNAEQRTQQQAKATEYVSAYQAFRSKGRTDDSEGSSDVRQSKGKAKGERRARQGDEPVLLSGFANLTIGQLTREVSKTSEKDLFLWRGRTLRLIYDGPCRDRLVDDTSGEIVYIYHRDREIEKLERKKISQATTSPELRQSKCVNKHTVATDSSAQSEELPVQGAACRSVDKCATRRMPSLVNGVVVMAPVSERTKEAVRWSPRQDDEILEHEDLCYPSSEGRTELVDLDSMSFVQVDDFSLDNEEITSSTSLFRL